MHTVGKYKCLIMAGGTQLYFIYSYRGAVNLYSNSLYADTML